MRPRKGKGSGTGVVPELGGRGDDESGRGRESPIVGRNEGATRPGELRKGLVGVRVVGE